MSQVHPGRPGTRCRRVVPIIAAAVLLAGGLLVYQARLSTIHRDSVRSAVRQRGGETREPVRAPAWMKTRYTQKYLPRRLVVDMCEAPGHMDDEFAEILGHCQDIELIQIVRGRGITDRGMAALARIDRLESVLVDHNSATDAGFRSLASLPRLRVVGFVGDNWTGSGLQSLSDSATLGDLYIGGRNVDDRHLKHIVNCPQLSTVACEHMRLSASGGAALAGLPSLEGLALVRSHSDLSFWRALKDSRSLMELFVYDSPVDDQVAAQIAQLGHLANLWIESGDLTNDGVRRLAELQGLQHLALVDVPVTDDTVGVLAERLDLESLIVYGSQITDECLPHLQRMRKLKFFGFQETQFSRDAFQRLRMTHPQCEEDNSTCIRAADAFPEPAPP